MAILVLSMTFVGCNQSPQKVGRSEWPSQMSELLAGYDQILNSIETIRFDTMVDDKYLWRIQGSIESVNSFVSDQRLEATSVDHPKYKELISNLPREWEYSPNEKSIFASPGYGHQHIEGANLILLVHDAKNRVTFVLYEWIF